MSDTKACSYCGEQVLAVAIKCKHCGSAIGTATSAAMGPTVAPAPAKTRWGALSTIGAVVLAGLAWAGYNNWSQTGSPSGHGFTQADVTNVEQSIRSEFK